MTEEVLDKDLGDSQGSDTVVTEGTANVEQPSGEAQEAAPVVEKTLTQSEVDKIVGAKKHEAYEKGKREAYESYYEALNAAPETQNQSSASNVQQTAQNAGDMSTMDIDSRINDRLKSVLQKQQETEYQKRYENMATQFDSKILAAKDKYPGLYEKLGKFNLINTVPLVDMANNMPNTAEIMHHVADNPAKWANLHATYGLNPELALAEMNKLSNSLIANQDAVKKASVPAPLSQVKPSNTGTDNGSMSVADYKAQDWLRG
jgi:hypothetical protein